MDKDAAEKIARFSKGRVIGRQETHLLGICKGMIADDVFNQEEAENLQAWIAHAEAVTSNPMLGYLLQRLSASLEDGVLDESESQELLNTLYILAGAGGGEVGELEKTKFLGYCQGLIADGKINQHEAKGLLGLVESMPTLDLDSVLAPVAGQIRSFLSDGHLDEQEAEELKRTLEGLSGGAQVLGEVAKSTTLPITDPPPDIVVPGSMFCLTGKFGASQFSRPEIKKKIEELGGTVMDKPTKKTQYLIVGTYVSDAWMQESYGKKIERAVELRAQQGMPAIVTEEYFLQNTGLG